MYTCVTTTAEGVVLTTTEGKDTCTLAYMGDQFRGLTLSTFVKWRSSFPLWAKLIFTSFGGLTLEAERLVKPIERPAESRQPSFDGWKEHYHLKAGECEYRITQTESAEYSGVEIERRRINSRTTEGLFGVDILHRSDCETVTLRGDLQVLTEVISILLEQNTAQEGGE